MELLSTFILLGRVTAVQVGRWPEKGPHLRCSLQGAQPGERGGGGSATFPERSVVQDLEGTQL